LQARIIEDLLDVSRAITGKLRLKIRPIEIGAVLEGAIESVHSAAEAKGVLVELDVAPGTRPVAGDPERLQQGLWNLLSNAIKFTPRPGRIDVRASTAGDHMRLTVRDTGDGIKPALLPRLFERFWQADSSTTRTQGGLGLGLAVVRHLVELH